MKTSKHFTTVMNIWPMSISICFSLFVISFLPSVSEWFVAYLEDFCHGVCWLLAIMNTFKKCRCNGVEAAYCVQICTLMWNDFITVQTELMCARERLQGSM